MASETQADIGVVLEQTQALFNRIQTLEEEQYKIRYCTQRSLTFTQISEFNAITLDLVILRRLLKPCIECIILHIIVDTFERVLGPPGKEEHAP